MWRAIRRWVDLDPRGLLSWFGEQDLETKDTFLESVVGGWDADERSVGLLREIVAEDPEISIESVQSAIEGIGKLSAERKAELMVEFGVRSE